MAIKNQMGKSPVLPLTRDQIISGLEDYGYADDSLYDNQTIIFSHTDNNHDIYFYAFPDIDTGTPQLGEIHVNHTSGVITFPDYPSENLQ